MVAAAAWRSGSGENAAVSESARFLVCVPTYDERENLERMIEALAAVRELEWASGDVLVIDDSSPDGTGVLADELAAGRSWLHVLHRPVKQGLGRAYLDGFRWALARDYDYVFEMDCDFSHDPSAIPSLLAPARAGADLVLGSRYCEGGRVENWGRTRRLISGAGCLYARVVLGVRVRDLTGGYKCFRRGVLETIELDAVDAQGYQFQVEMTYRALLLGFTVQEVPITFADRVAGGSKMSRSIVLEAMRRVPLLRLEAARGRLPKSGDC
jgi:dolichol-phosphate mannosyltransferase